MIKDTKMITTLHEQVSKLWRVLCDTKRLGNEWGISVQEDADFKDDYTAGDEMYKLGKKAVAVVAGCNVIIELTGKEQRDGAAALIADANNPLPAALLAALKPLAK